MPAPAKKPKFIRTSRIPPKVRSLFNRSMRKNYRGKGHRVAFKYTKPDGSIHDKTVESWTSKRTKDGNYVLVGHSIDANDIRSYRLDRIDHGSVKEAMDHFWGGFNKKAGGGEAMALGAMAGILGMTVGDIMAGTKNKEVLERWAKDKEGLVDAKKTFKEWEPHVPGTVIMTKKDLHDHIDSEESLDKKMILQAIRDGIERGNAMALHPDMVPGFLKKKLPDIVKDKRIVFSADSVHPSVLAHEMGHIKDYDEAKKSGALAKFFRKFKTDYSGEVAAWDKVPAGANTDRKEEALGTYRRATQYPLAGLAGGGLLGAILGGLIGNKRVVKISPPEMKVLGSETPYRPNTFREAGHKPDPRSLERITAHRSLEKVIAHSIEEFKKNNSEIFGLMSPKTVKKSVRAII